MVRHSDGRMIGYINFHDAPDGPGIEESRRSHANCELECLRLSVIDLQCGEIVAERLLDSDLTIMSWVP